MNVNELDEFKDYISVWQQIDGFRYIGINNNVCGGMPTIIGTRILPQNIVHYGTIEETMEDFDLTREQIEEAYAFLGE